MDGFFQAFTCFNKTCYERIEVALEVASMNEKNLIVLLDEHDDGCGEGRPYLLAALGAFLADVGCHLHRSAADTAEMGVHVPVVQFLALASLLIKLRCELIETGAQTAHLELRMVCDGFRNGEGFHLRSVLHRCDVEDMGPGLCLYRTFFTAWNRIGSVFSLLQQDVTLAKYKPILHYFFILNFELYDMLFWERFRWELAIASCRTAIHSRAGQQAWSMLPVRTSSCCWL